MDCARSPHIPLHTRQEWNRDRLTTLEVERDDERLANPSDHLYELERSSCEESRTWRGRVVVVK